MDPSNSKESPSVSPERRCPRNNPPCPSPARPASYHNPYTSERVNHTLTRRVAHTSSPTTTKSQNAVEVLSDRLVVRLERCPAIDKMEATARETERDKQEFTDAINHCFDLLRANNYITEVNSDVITRRAAVIGQEMYECLKKIKDRTRALAKSTNYDKIDRVPVIDLLERDHSTRNHVVNPVNQMHFIKDEPLEIIETEETESYEDEGEKQITVGDVKSLGDSDDFDMKRPGSEDDGTRSALDHQLQRARFARSRKRKRPYARIPVEEKIRVVNLARANPSWTLAWLKERSGSERLNSIIQLRQWEKQVLSKGSIIHKLNVINGWVYSRYIEEKEKNFDVSNSMLREWAIGAAQKFVYPRFKFEANDAWLAGFKKIHGLKHGDIYED